MREKFKIIALLTLVVFIQEISADYPIVAYRYLADPGVLVYDGRVYIYCSNDDDNDADDGYEMKSIVCVSSSDLKNWTDHGIVFQVPEGASWAGYSWAPSPAARDGKFYLYFGNGGNGIGVAVSDSPTGPFTDPIGQRLVSTSTPGVLPAENMWLFDPMTFIDDDGQAYMYFGGNGEDNLRVIKLNSDMISIDGAATSFHVPYFFEAAWMHKHNETYYFSYSTNPSNGIRIDYMTSDNPTSGFTYAGVLSPQPPNNNNNNHQATFKFNGQWYQAYHNRIVAQENNIPTTYKRNLALDHFVHNENGTIKTMVNTIDGIEQVGNLNPYEIVEAETINDQNGIETEAHDEGGMYVTNIAEGKWIKVRGVDFGSAGAATFSAKIASDIKLGNTNDECIEIRLDGISGTLAGTVPISYTGGSDVWKTEIAAIEGANGIHDIYFAFKGESSENLFNFDNWQFTQKTDSQSLFGVNAVIDNAKVDTITGYNTTSITVTAIYTDGTSADVTSETEFTTDQENIISISDSIIKGIDYGTATVIASYGNNSDSVKVVVKSRDSELRVYRIYPEDSDIGLFSGTSTSVQIYAEFDDGHVEEVSEKAIYENPSPDIITVSKGIIKALKEGEVDITVTYKGEIGENKSTSIHVLVSSGSAVWLEPECAEIGENWNIINDNQASNNYYISVKSGLESLDNAPTDIKNLVIIPFTLSARGSYTIYGRLNCPTYDDDSFWIKVDNGDFTMHNGLVTSGWEWIKFNDYVFRNGAHTLTIGFREDGALLDKIVISNYDEVPEGMGGEAENLCDPTGIESKSEVPLRFGLEQNFPNPFNPSTVIGYQLPKTSKTSIKIFNTVGQEIAVLFEGIKQSGSHQIMFDGSHYSSGVYFYQLKAGEFVSMKKFVLMK